METPVYRLFRCKSCMSLLTDWHIQKHGRCHRCGGNLVGWGTPKNLWERLVIFYWSLTLQHRRTG